MLNMYITGYISDFDIAVLRIKLHLGLTPRKYCYQTLLSLSLASDDFAPTAKVWSRKY